MKISNIETDDRVFIIAEIGNNHEGNFSVAQQMVAQAAQAGADAVKFQTFKTEHYISTLEQDRFARLKKFELSHDEFAKLAEFARTQGVLFLSTPFDLHSATFLKDHVVAFKIASGDNTFYPLLKHVAQMDKPIILSTGLLDIAGIKRTLEFIRGCWSRSAVNPDLAVLHCVTAYPVPDSEAKVAAISQIKEAIGDATVGYSDHTLGILASVCAVANGARIIEKHFTLRRDYSDFRDHALSADPAEFAEMVQAIRRSEELLGTRDKLPAPSEVALESAVRRSIAAAHDLSADHLLATEDLTWVRPGTGFPPGSEHEVIGRVLSHHVRRGELITEECLRPS